MDGRRQRYVGRSRAYNERTGQEMSAGWDIELDAEELTAGISSGTDPAQREEVRTRSRAKVALVRTLLEVMERAAWRERRGSGEFAVPKPTTAHTPAPCPQCNGQGGNEDAEGNWVSCPVCGEG